MKILLQRMKNGPGPALSRTRTGLAGWLAALFLLANAGTTLAQIWVNSGDYWYYDVSPNEVTLCRYTGPASVLSLPGSLDGKTVVAIGNLSGNPRLTSVTIPSSVTNIMGITFQHCGNLTSVTIPNSVNTIGAGAFEGCLVLTSLNIPSGLTKIEHTTFRSCFLLPTVTIPKSVTSIGAQAFDGCRSMSSITIPSNVTSIADYAFSGCNAATRVTIPDSVTNIGQSAFAGCRMASVTIPDRVPNIAYRTFSGCANLTSVTIGQSVTDVGGEGFRYCDRLKSICFKGNAPTWSGNPFFGFGTPTVYYVQGTTGWTNLWAGRPTSSCLACDEEFFFYEFSPADQEVNVFWDDPQLGATFAGNMDLGTVNSSNFQFNYSGSTNPIPGSFSVTGKTVRFTPTSPLQSNGQKIFATIKGGADGVRSATGGNLPQSYYWSFSTMPSVTVHAVAAQVVDGMDWVADKEASVRVRAAWGDETNHTAIFMITGNVTVAWNDGSESPRDNVRWAHWDGNPYSTFRDLGLTREEWFQGNAAVFSTPRGTMPESMINPLGPKSIRATIELQDRRGRAKQFVGGTGVNVKPLAADAPWKICFIPLAVGAFTNTTAIPSIGAIARDQVEFIQRVYPLPEAAILNTWQEISPDTYSYWNHKNPLNYFDNQYMAALATDLEDFREASGLDVVVGVVPTGWLTTHAGAVGLNGANWITLHGLPVAFIEEDVLQHVAAHEVGHIYAGHSRADFNSSGFDPVRGAWYALGVLWFRGDFMDAYAAGFGQHLTWANRQTYGALMNHFVAGGAGLAPTVVPRAEVKAGGAMGAQDAATNVLAVSGLLMQTGSSCTADIVRIYLVANMAASISSSTGDYTVEARNVADGLLSAVRINPSFETNTLGNQIAFFKVYFSNPSAIAKIAVKKLTVGVGSASRPVTAPTVAVTAPAPGAIVTGPLTVSWTGNSGGAITYGVFYRPETNAPWAVLGFGKTNQTLTAGVGDVACGSNAQVRVVANDGFNTVEALSGLFRVQQPPVVVSCSPSNTASFVPIETAVAITFSAPMTPATITANAVTLKDSGGMMVAGSVFYDPYAQRVVFTPVAPLADLSVYTARVEAAVASMQGQAMTGAFVSVFRTCIDTNDYSEAMCANGINTLLEAYIAGLDPNDPQSIFQLSILWPSPSETALLWNAVTGRVYSVYWTTNLLSGFQCLGSNLPWTQGRLAISNNLPRGFYYMDVRLP